VWVFVCGGGGEMLCTALSYLRWCALFLQQRAIDLSSCYPVGRSQRPCQHRCEGCECVSAVCGCVSV